jgi:hypothetical protein
VNPPAGDVDFVTRWLVISRAGVLPMTLTAGGAAGLLAVRERSFAAGWFALAFVGIVLAHGLMVGFYIVVVACVLVDALPWPALVTFGAVPLLIRAIRALGRPRPARAPRGFSVWPLWFAAFTFTHTRRAGALLIVGLAVAAIFDIKPLGIV